jgi:hypothetical protein
VYDPRIGRFLSRDPYIDGVGSSQGANGYAYVHNNPLSRWDPTGYTYEGLEEIVVTGSRLRFTLGSWSAADWHHFVARFPYRNEDRGGRGAGGDGGDGGGAKEEPAQEEPQEPKPLCEGAPQILDPSLAALGASAATIANNSTGETPRIGSRGVDAVTSARIAPFQQLAANTDWALVAKMATRASWGLNVVNIGVGFRSSVSDGMYAVADFGIGVALPFVPWVGIPASIAYGAHGGSKALVNDVKYFTGSCTRQ